MSSTNLMQPPVVLRGFASIWLPRETAYDLNIPSKVRRKNLLTKWPQKDMGSEFSFGMKFFHGVSSGRDYLDSSTITTRPIGFVQTSLPNNV